MVIFTLGVIVAGGSKVAYAQQIAEIFVNDDANKGVKSEVFLVGPDRTETFFSVTDTKGLLLLKPAYRCKQGQRVKAKPEDAIYYHSPAAACSDGRINLKVSSREIVATLQSHAKAATERRDYGTAALIYNEIAVRVSSSDEQLARAAEEKTYEFTAKTLGREGPLVYDPGQAKRVMSPDLAKAVAKYQREKRINEGTGRLDFKTLSELAGGASIHSITAPVQ